MTVSAESLRDLATPFSDVPRRLLLVSTDMGMGGGAEEQVIRLAYAAREWNWDVAIISLVPPSPMPPDFHGRGITLDHLNMRRALPDPRGLWKLARWIRDFQPDIVHSHMVHANLVARAARLLAPFPVLVGTLHNQTMAGVTRDWSPLFERAHRLTDRLADHTTAISGAAARAAIRARAVPAAKLEVVPNGIDTRLYRLEQDRRNRMRRELGVEDQFVWVAVGRLERAKAHATLLRAMARLEPAHRTLLICGQGSLREELEVLAAELGLADRVRFLGLRGDIPAVLNAADAFALPSDLEGLPLVLLQAGAASLPIVATDVGGNAEVIVPGETGEIVRPGDPTAFSEAMSRIERRSHANRLAMGRAGADHVVSNFEAEHVVAQWRHLYLRLLLDSDHQPHPPRRVASIRRERPALSHHIAAGSNHGSALERDHAIDSFNR